MSGYDRFSFSEGSVPQRSRSNSRPLSGGGGGSSSSRKAAAAGADMYASHATSKYFVLLSKEGKIVCTYCHIHIKKMDLVLMTRSQWTQFNNISKNPTGPHSGGPLTGNSGFHCDCFFLSTHGAWCTKVADICGFSALSNYHRRYICRKITSTPDNEKQLPTNLKVGYVKQGNSGAHYCEQCSIIVTDSELKIVGYVNHLQDLIVYHLNCFSRLFGKIPVKLAGLHGLPAPERARVTALLRVVGPGTAVKPGPPGALTSAPILSTAYSNSGYPSGQDPFSWSSAKNTADSSAWRKAILPTPPRKPHPPDQEKVVVKTGTIKTEIRAILQTYSHDQITSKMVRRMLEEKLGCDLSPHRRYIDNCIMSMLDQMEGGRAGRKTPQVKEEGSRKKQPLLPGRGGPSYSPRDSKFVQRAGPAYPREPSYPRGPSPGSRGPRGPSPGSRDHSRSASRGSRDSRSISPGRLRGPRSVSPTRSGQGGAGPAHHNGPGSGVREENPVVGRRVPDSAHNGPGYHGQRGESPVVGRSVPDSVQNGLPPRRDSPAKAVKGPTNLAPSERGASPAKPSGSSQKEPQITTTPISPAKDRSRIFVDVPDAGEEEAEVSSPELEEIPTTSLEDISPFAIMGTQVDEIVQGNVDTTVNRATSLAAWGSPETSPVKEPPAREPTPPPPPPPPPGPPINLCQCCLCIFRIPSLEELPSLYRHIVSHHLEHRKCAVCELGFEDCYQLMLHVVEFHRSEGAVKCGRCGEVFKFHQELARHLDQCFELSDDSEAEGGEESGEREGEEVREGGEEEGEGEEARTRKRKRDLDPTMRSKLVDTLRSTRNTLDRIDRFIVANKDLEFNAPEINFE